MSVVRRTVDRVRQPEYTGENRCLPCTATNVGIALVLAGLLGYLWLPAGIGFLVLALASIWLRGYLVPGTPELTKRYFPEWLLARFDKAPTAADDQVTPETVEIDPETTLVEAGVVEPCVDEDDLCLSPGFRTAWHAEMADLRDGDAEKTALAHQLDLDPDEVSFESFGTAYVAKTDGVRLGQWESRAALLADLAAARELPDWVADWERLPVTARSQLLGGLRIFVEECPECGGPVTATTETVESCCRSHEVVAAGCDDCEARLLEVPYDEEAAA